MIVRRFSRLLGLNCFQWAPDFITLFFKLLPHSPRASILNLSVAPCLRNQS